MRNLTTAFFALAMAAMFASSAAFVQVGFADVGTPGDGLAASDTFTINTSDEPYGTVVAASSGTSTGLAAIEDVNDELFESYVDGVFEAAGAPVVRKAALRVNAAVPKTAYAQLNDLEKAIYDILLPEIKAVAAGAEHGTVFTIETQPLVDTNVLQLKYTATDLNVGTLASDGKLTEEGEQALKDFIGNTMKRVNRALLQDHPFEMFWFDKTNGGLSYSYNYYPCFNEADPYVQFGGETTFTLKFTVAKGYSATDTTKTYETTSNLSKVKTAATNAAAVVSKHRAENDIRKLDSYRGEICDLTDYNGPAMEQDWDYGDPWQLIDVFDGDPATTVVCEGYSKAFKRLCDLSTFDNTSLACFIASGYMHSSNSKKTSGEEHMWNIVSINGYSYLVDVTNCDAYSSGAGTTGSKLVLANGGANSAYEPGKGLFMRGSDTVAAVSDFAGVAGGDYQNGWRVTVPAQSVQGTSSVFSTSASTVDYYYEVSTSAVLPSSVLSLASWDCPLETAADSALAVEAQIAGIGEVTEAKVAAVAAARTAYDALSQPQQALVSNASVLAADEAAAASLSLRGLEWGKRAEQSGGSGGSGSGSGSGGSYALVAGSAGDMAWTCTDDAVKRFRVHVFKKAAGEGGAGEQAGAGGSGADTLVLSRTADFTRSEGAREVYSYSLVQDGVALESGTYYFAVEPLTGNATGAKDVDPSALAKSGEWEYEAPQVALSVSDVKMTDGTLSWALPASSAGNSANLDKFTYWVYRSDSQLSAEALAAAAKVTPAAADLPTGLEFVVGADYAAEPGDTAGTCTVDLPRFLRTYANNNIIDLKEGYYYVNVRAVSKDLSACQSSPLTSLVGPFKM